jgi:2-haloacid dehalogenase
MPATTDRPALLLFDINETLLDLAPLRTSIERILPGGAELWFTTMLHHATAMSLAGRFAPLPEIGAAALRMLAEGRGVALSPHQAQMAIAPIARLPAHRDVAPALARLRDAGFRLAALSNSTTAGLRAQLAHADLTPLFDAQFSVQDFGVYKPHPGVYLGATARMRVAPGQAMLVAAHGWDVAGAGWAGLRTAFVCRGNKRPFPLAEEPALVVRDLAELAGRLGA